MEPEEIKLSRTAYISYGQVTDYKNYQGLPMPAYDDLPDKIKAAWAAAVMVIVAKIRGEDDENILGGVRNGSQQSGNVDTTTLPDKTARRDV